jgi:hypothetical protein
MDNPKIKNKQNFDKIKFKIYTKKQGVKNGFYVSVKRFNKLVNKVLVLDWKGATSVLKRFGLYFRARDNE